MSSHTVQAGTTIRGSLPRVLQRLAALHEAARRLPDVLAVEVLERSSDGVTSRWEAVFEGFPCCWVQRERVSEEEATLSFEGVEGDLEGMTGTFRAGRGPLPGTVRVVCSVRLDLGFFAAGDAFAAAVARGLSDRLAALLDGVRRDLETSTPEDLRADPRYSAHLEAGCLSEETWRGSARILDLSEGGARIAANTPLRRGESLVLTVPFPGREEVLPGRIVWSDSRGAGIRFAPERRPVARRILQEVVAFC